MDRSEQELVILEEVSQILGEGSEIGQLFQRAMSLISDRLGVERGAMVVWEEAAGQFRMIAFVGYTPAEQARGRYQRGEGVTGRVLSEGEPAIIPDIANHPDFLHRTRDTDAPDAGPMSFICVPVKEGERCVGGISMHKAFESQAQLEADARLLKILAGSIAQALRIHNSVQVEKSRWLEEKKELTDNLRMRYRFDNIIGSSPVMLDVLAMIGQVATSRATCLLLGETGCGKELIAKAVHYNSPRRDKPLIRVNCGALSPQLLESELFGHVKGAFTGAMKDKVGRFEAADGGTIFLDEVGTLSTELQVKMLRVLQERELERVGDYHTIKVDVRVIAATNLDLEEEVRKGNFREDLYYRLNVVTINLPPLRSRREDIPRLIDFFLDRYNKENGRNLRKLSRDVLNTLLRYPWPGNVRELENAVERAVVLSTGEEFTEDLLPLQIRVYAQQVRGDTTDESIEAITSRLATHSIKQFAVYEGQVHDLVINEVERQLIREALEYNDGVKIRTADFLGINRNTLNKKVKDLGIEAGE